MDMKYLIAASAFVLVSASASQAADVVVHQESAQVVPPVIVAPAFSWTGFYFGGHLGGLSGAVEKTFTGFSSYFNNFDPKPPTFFGGLYAGSNVDFGGGFVAGVDTDFSWFGDNETKGEQPSAKLTEDDVKVFENMASKLKIGLKSGEKFAKDNVKESSITLKEKWAGATRVRVGFAADRIMPYIAGGLAYASFNNTTYVKAKKADNDAKLVVDSPFTDETKTMIGYTIGAGVDFAVTDNVVLRTEYRYSDYGKKKFVDEGFDFGYKTNDFRVGVAYKF